MSAAEAAGDHGFRRDGAHDGDDRIATSWRDSAAPRRAPCSSTRRTAFRRTRPRSRSAPSTTSPSAFSSRSRSPASRGRSPSIRASGRPSLLPRALARLRTADLVFSGPGSPTYALSTWRGSAVHEALADKLAQRGVVVFASAAALTVGRYSLPVYEIYKVGQPIHWLDGPRSAEPDRVRPELRAHPPLGQCRGRNPRHALLLHGRAKTGRARGDAARRWRGCSASTSTPRW